MKPKFVYVVTITSGDRESYSERTDTIWYDEELAKGRVKEYNKGRNESKDGTYHLGFADYDTFAIQDS